MSPVPGQTAVTATLIPASPLDLPQLVHRAAATQRFVDLVTTARRNPGLQSLTLEPLREEFTSRTDLLLKVPVELLLPLSYWQH